MVINQHASNHGDEAACLALLRELHSRDSEYKIKLLYNSKTRTRSDYVNYDNQINHLPYDQFSIISKGLIFLSFILPSLIFKVIPFLGCRTLRSELGELKNSEIVVSAPGGVNIGIYKDWRYLWRLFAALELKKKLAIYSISFGPLPSNWLFRRISVRVLKRASFLSLRDARSQGYANSLKIKYTESIDTAFLNQYVPKNFDFTKLPEKFGVVVPNELYRWHVNYKNIKTYSLDELYVSIISEILKQNLEVVLLPQMFGSEDDTAYFKKIISKLPSEDQNKVYIFPTKHSSDIQQEVIKKARIIVGARYHSIIFAINSGVPFLSLAYEDKMTFTLSLLELDRFNIPIPQLLDNGSGEIPSKLRDLLSNQEQIRKSIVEKKYLAQSRAKNTFQVFYEKIMM